MHDSATNEIQPNQYLRFSTVSAVSVTTILITVKLGGLFKHEELAKAYGCHPLLIPM